MSETQPSKSPPEPSPPKNICVVECLGAADRQKTAVLKELILREYRSTHTEHPR